MDRRCRSIPRATALIALAAVSLGGCAEVHHGFEAVARVGGTSPTPAADVADDAVGTVRPAVKTVRPRGAPRARAVDTEAAERAPAVASAVPTPRQIFDFHPPGSAPDSWRQPFVIDTGDGPLAADVRRSTAELKAYRSDTARAATLDAAKAKGTASGPAPMRCGEAEVATAQPGCAVPPPKAADAGPTKP